MHVAACDRSNDGSQSPGAHCDMFELTSQKVSPIAGGQLDVLNLRTACWSPKGSDWNPPGRCP